MKKVTLGLLAIALFASCNSYNDKMNDLLAKKSKLESSSSLAKWAYEDAEHAIDEYFEKELAKGNFNVTKSKKYKSMTDSANKLLHVYGELDFELNGVKYSIDSLSKLK
jgi:hypothetical protein